MVRPVAWVVIEVQMQAGVLARVAGVAGVGVGPSLLF